ncbi:MAG: DNA repair protein RecO [Selenomonadaceae bacterium]|nr:DNA repair protein RecO [Selenomonadaceae bacterium]MBQ3726301.1 DNA repair protein RecO [Selenomonadaceae bacterium]MBQ9495977.1 DNA repair protein RecO [Selenomonadaceae bacterium]
METFTVEAVVLKTDDFGDANRVVTLFTKEFGKLEANAYGCRRARSPLSGATQMFNHISAEISRGSKVDTIREADILNFYDALTKDLERLAYASLLFEIVNRMTFPRQRELETFELLTNSLPALNSRNPRIAALIGACQFMETSGVQLNFSRCVHCGVEIDGDAGISLLDGGAVCMNCLDAAQDARPYPEALRKTFETMLAFNWRDETKLTFNSRQLVAAENFFVDYVQSVLGSSLRSVQFIREFIN